MATTSRNGRSGISSNTEPRNRTFLILGCDSALDRRLGMRFSDRMILCAVGLMFVQTLAPWAVAVEKFIFSRNVAATVSTSGSYTITAQDSTTDTTTTPETVNDGQEAGVATGDEVNAAARG